MTTGDIQAHLLEIYGTEISRETISKITDQIVEDMNSWQRRPLDRLYPVLLIDAIVIKVRDRRQPPMTITTAYTKNPSVMLAGSGGFAPQKSCPRGCCPLCGPPDVKGPAGVA